MHSRASLQFEMLKKLVGTDRQDHPIDGPEEPVPFFLTLIKSVEGIKSCQCVHYQSGT